MTVVKRVLDAIRDTSRQIDTCDFGEIVVKVHDGWVVQVEVLSKHRPKHTKTNDFEVEDGYAVYCECGYVARDKTKDGAMRDMNEHLARHS